MEFPSFCLHYRNGEVKLINLMQLKAYATVQKQPSICVLKTHFPKTTSEGLFLTVEE